VNVDAVTTGADADAAGVSERVEPPAEPKVNAEVVNVAAAAACDTPKVAPSATVTSPPPVCAVVVSRLPA
jgi:hypothetical protein